MTNNSSQWKEWNLMELVCQSYTFKRFVCRTVTRISNVIEWENEIHCKKITLSTDDFVN